MNHAIDGSSVAPPLYPARATLSPLLARIDAGNIDDAEEQRLLGRLADVVDAGLDLEGLGLATEAFFRLPTCRDQDGPRRAACQAAAALPVDRCSSMRPPSCWSWCSPR